jgi:hypothetical protein
MVIGLQHRSSDAIHDVMMLWGQQSRKEKKFAKSGAQKKLQIG